MIETEIDQNLLSQALQFASYLEKKTRHSKHYMIFKFLSMINVDIACVIMLIAFFPHPHFLTHPLRIAFVVFSVLSAVAIAHASVGKPDLDLLSFPKLTLNSNISQQQKHNIAELFYIAQRTQKRQQASNIITSNFTYKSCVTKLLRLLKLDIVTFATTHHD